MANELWSDWNDAEQPAAQPATAKPTSPERLWRDWNSDDAGQPAQTAASRPAGSFTPDELALLQGYAAPADDAQDGGDEVLADARRALASGYLSINEVSRLYGLTAEEAAQIATPQPKGPSRATIDAELRQIEKLRRDDRRAYFKDEALQARERELLELRAKMKTAPAARNGTEHQTGDAGIAPELIAEWEASGGLEHNLANAAATAQAVMTGVEDAAEFQAGFGALPPGAQTAAFRILAAAPGYTPSANDAAMKAFAETPEGSELVAEWGGKSAQSYGRARWRISSALGQMSAEDRKAAASWYDGLSPSQAAAVLRALAQR